MTALRIRGSGSAAPVPLYERVGGQAFFDRLVEQFYDGVEARPRLRVMYPEELTDAKRHLALFLGQYFGGPTTYLEERGHPMLRARHAPYVIGAAERDDWLEAMLDAVDAVNPPAAERQELVAYLDLAAHQLRNA